MSIFRLKKTDNEQKVEELRAKRNKLQEEIDVIQSEINTIQSEIDDIFKSEMNPHFKKGDYIKIHGLSEQYDEYMIVSKDLYRLVDGVRVSGPSVVVWYDHKNQFVEMSFYEDDTEHITTDKFNNVSVLTEGEFYNAIDTAFTNVRNKIAETKEQL